VVERLAAEVADGSFDQAGALAPALLAITSGARGNFRLLARHLAATGSIDGSHVSPATGAPFRFGITDAVRHSLREGITIEEAIALMAGYRRSLKRMIQEESAALSPVGRHITRPANASAEGLHFFARALRSANPGLVFAAAAERGERDPLTAIDSRLFAGLPPT